MKKVTNISLKVTRELCVMTGIYQQQAVEKRKSAAANVDVARTGQNHYALPVRERSRSCLSG
jgi:hypothetical protein